MMSKCIANNVNDLDPFESPTCLMNVHAQQIHNAQKLLDMAALTWDLMRVCGLEERIPEGIPWHDVMSKYEVGVIFLLAGSAKHDLEAFQSRFSTYISYPLTTYSLVRGPFSISHVAMQFDLVVEKVEFVRLMNCLGWVLGLPKGIEGEELLFLLLLGACWKQRWLSFFVRPLTVLLSLDSNFIHGVHCYIVGVKFTHKPELYSIFFCTPLLDFDQRICHRLRSDSQFKLGKCTQTVTSKW